MTSSVVFVCVENSCRSQIAEALARKWGRGFLDVSSAGSRPSGKVNLTAAKLLAEKGIDVSGQFSKGFSELPDQKWDYVITMGCGDACPIVPAQRKEDWNILDPKNMAADDFRQVLDLIESKVKVLIDNIRRAEA
jgi:arsenate reductase (thioredoxin)